MPARLSEHAADNGKGRAFEQICDRIRAQLAAGTLRPGDKLPPEREMAAKFKAGRNAVREALRSLEMAGVVRLEKGRTGGAYIRPGNASRVTVAMRDLLDFGSISLDEITESRTVLMDVVTRLACERATAAQIDALENTVDEIEEATRAGDLGKRAERIAEFYASLAGSTRNRVLVTMVTSLSEIVRRFLETIPRTGKPMESLITSWRRFIRHLRARDADAASADLRSHLMATHRQIEKAMQTNGSSTAKPSPKARPTARAAASARRRRAAA